MLDAADGVRPGILTSDGARIGEGLARDVDGRRLLFHLDSTVYSVFLILQVGLDPLQLVLMGTVLEVSYLLFDVPTGSSPTRSAGSGRS